MTAKFVWVLCLLIESFMALQGRPLSVHLTKKSNLQNANTTKQTVPKIDWTPLKPPKGKDGSNYEYDEFKDEYYSTQEKHQMADEDEIEETSSSGKDICSEPNPLDAIKCVWADFTSYTYTFDTQRNIWIVLIVWIFPLVVVSLLILSYYKDFCYDCIPLWCKQKALMLDMQNKIINNKPGFWPQPEGNVRTYDPSTEEKKIYYSLLQNFQLM